LDVVNNYIYVSHHLISTHTAPEELPGNSVMFLGNLRFTNLKQFIPISFGGLPLSLVIISKPRSHCTPHEQTSEGISPNIQQ
jgi:hypothetical protein